MQTDNHVKPIEQSLKACLYMETSNETCNRHLVSTLYKRYSDDLKRYFVSYTHDMMAAEDMLHDLFEKLMTLDIINDATAHSLIFVMARHIIVNDTRHKAFVRQSERNMREQLSYYDDSLARRVEARELLALERSRLEAMPVKRAEVYKLYRNRELPAGEIAKQLNLSKRTVEAHIYTATREMRSYLRGIV